jgi:hypothetical protein
MGASGEPADRERSGSKPFHVFKETNDAGIPAAASGTMGVTGSQANALGVTTATLRATRCAVPGCGRERHDPIHAVPED